METITSNLPTTHLHQNWWNFVKNDLLIIKIISSKFYEKNLFI